MRKLVILLLIAFGLSGCYLKGHRVGRPGTYDVETTILRPSSLTNKKMYVEFASSKGIFSNRTRDDFRYFFSSNIDFSFYQMAALKLVASGVYKYVLSTSHPREAMLYMTNRRGERSNDTYWMRLNFYNQHMGIFKLWRARHQDTDMATGIFKIESEEYHV